MQLIARLIGFCFLSLVSLPLFASPFIYTFVGDINSISQNDVFTSSATIDGIDFSVGDSMEYQFIFDFQRQGFCDFPSALSTDDCNGEDIPDDFVNGNLARDYFYVEFLSANKESPLSYLDIDYNLGVDNILGNVGQAFASSALLLQSNGLLVRDWQETTDIQNGTSVVGLDYWDNGLFAADLVFGVITTNLTLDSIRPVPVPQTMLLFLLGGGILLFWQVRGRNTRLLNPLKN